MVFNRLVQTIVALFEKNAEKRSSGLEKDEGGNSANSLEATEARTLPNERTGFEESLSLLVEARKNLLAGSLELIGLDEVRIALGVEWPLFAERVVGLAEHEIRASLDPADTFRRYGDLSFLIHFGHLDKDAAEKQAKHTAFQIKAALLERLPEIAGIIAIRPFVGEVDTSTLDKNEPSLTDALFARLVRMRVDVVNDLKQRRKSLARDVRVLFSPVWHSKREVTLLNRCLVDLTYYHEVSLQIQELGDPGEIANFSAEIDYLVLTKSLEALHALRGVGRAAILIIPMELSTIRNEETSKEYVRLLDAAPPSYQKFVILEIRGVEQHHSPNELFRAVECVRPLVKSLIVELSIDDSRIFEIPSDRMWAVSIDLSKIEIVDRGMMSRLQRFVAASGDKETLASGARTIGLVRAASRTGFTYIEGTAVHLPVREPRQVLRLRFLPSSPHGDGSEAP